MKNYKFGFLLIWSGLILSCAHQSPKETSSNKLVKFLNQEISENGIKVNLNEDLFKTYKVEKKSWKKKMEERSFGKKDYDKKNKFLASFARQQNSILQKKMENLARKNIGEAKKKKEIQRVFELSRSYKFVGGTKNLSKRQLEIGFCFYRALLVHYYLLENGFDPGDIGKIWAVGSLVAPPVLWSFHVATFVRNGNEIIILDPVYDEPMVAKEWTAKLSEYSAEKPNPLLRFYISDPRKFLPNSEAYSEEILNHKNIKEQSQRLVQYLKL